jgi:hypothetical protein
MTTNEYPWVTIDTDNGVTDRFATEAEAREAAYPGERVEFYPESVAGVTGGAA